MSFKLLGWLLVFMLLLSIALAHPIKIIVSDSTFNNSFADDLISYIIYDANGTVLTHETTDLSGESDFSLDLPNQYLTLELFHLSNNMQPDYFGQTSLLIVDSTSQLKIPLRSSGRLLIIAQSKDDVPLPDVIVRVDCPSHVFKEDSYFTDALGEVTIDFVPAETCFLRVAYDDYIFRENIDIIQGQKTIKIITFDEIKLRKTNQIYYVIFFLIIIFTLFLIFRTNIRKLLALNKIESESSSNSEVISSSKANDGLFNEELIAVLNTKEEEVVRFLLTEYRKSNNNALSPEQFFLNQATISFGTNIPKTSLVRVFNSLSQKGLLRVEKFGKSKRVYFGSKLLKEQ